MSTSYWNKIILTNFRNYSKQEVGFCPGLNCLTGKNGVGKTNLLDSVYYLCMAKSRLNGLDKYVIHHESGFMRLEGRYTQGEDKGNVVVKLIPGKSKQIEKNNVLYKKAAEHVGFIPVVMIVPDDTEMISGGSEERRRFLNVTLSQLDKIYLNKLIRYNSLLKQRNALLKQFGDRIDTKLLRTYDEQMSEPAKYIFEKRKKFIEELKPVFKNRYNEIARTNESVNLEYRSHLSNGIFEELCKENLRKDCILQRTNMGIHKDDIIFLMDDNPMKRFASQGQLKSFVLSLGLSRFHILDVHGKVKPILLLDDIFDKLDKDRVAQLLELLSNEGFGQIFLTDTHESRVREATGNFNRELRIFKVERGQVEVLR